MTTLTFWPCSDDRVGFLLGHHFRTRKPTWTSLQDQKANVAITAGPEIQRGHHYMTRMPTWISLQDQKANVVITAEPGSQRGHDHVGFLVLQ
jgi:frataxin-like iron-binding protein CyaY